MATKHFTRIRRVALVVIIVVAVCVGGDFGFGAYVEYKVSKILRSQLQVHDDPRVAVRGFPFTTQALAGDYRTITVDAGGVRVNKQIRNLAFSLNLRDVRVPISKLATGTADRIPVAKVDGSAQISSADLARMLHLSDLQLSPVPLRWVRNKSIPVTDKKPDPMEFSGENSHHGTRAGFRMLATLPLAGQRTQVTVYGIASLRHGRVVANPERIKLANAKVTATLPDSIVHGVLGKFAFKVNSGMLPFTVHPTKVTIQDGAVSVNGVARNVVLHPGANR